MAGSISDALENKLLDHVLKTTPFSVPTNIYVALSTADPLDTGAGVAEPADGYARVVMNSWDVAAARATENTNQITFPQASGNWGTITHWAIYDAVTGGNFLAHGDFTVSKSCPIGTNLYVAACDIDVVFSANGICTNLANKLLDHVFKTTEYKRPDVTGTDIAFVDGGAGEDTITSGANAFGDFATGDIITVSGSTSNDGTYTLTAAAVGTLTVATGLLTAEGASASVTIQTSLYVALFTTSPTDTGVAGTEVSGGAYARKICDVWDAAAAGASENTAAITFATATALWGTVTHFLLLDDPSGAASSSNTLIWATITPNRTIGIDDVAKYAIGALDITLD